MFSEKAVSDGALMQISVWGLHAVVRDRQFSWAFALTQQTHAISRSLDLSFRATGNGAFVWSVAPVRAGEMRRAGGAIGRLAALSEEYLKLVQVAETSGRVPERSSVKSAVRRTPAGA